ncbi:MAG: mannitol-1-phosphate 5-dehydrogenase [Gemmatimonadota bacterium]|nr:mannitol-1-phosphate 5-dehydrogenase [Gemmatimonadota bacterium]
MKKLIQFGAGNIGRSFVGQLFSAAGYEVVFVDVDKALVRALNRQRAYRVEIRDSENRTIKVGNVRAVNAADIQTVVRETASASVCATAVGPMVLPRLFPALAGAIELRYGQGGGPLDIILCENLRNAAGIARQGISDLLPPGFPVDSCLGLVETSIGKMVPIIPAGVREKDPLTVYAEAYNTLILDRRGFINKVPGVEGLDAKENMKAYVDRKSFIHNLGHAALAYYSYLVAPETVYTYQAVEDAQIRSWVKQAMDESGRLLIGMYPEEFNGRNQQAHIEDLLNRFGNRALGDTIHRVGRDLMRKLSSRDRVAGPLLEGWKRGHVAPWTAHALACGLFFQAPGPEGLPFPEDRKVAERAEKESPEVVLTELCGLPRPLIAVVANAYRMIQKSRNPQGLISREQFLAVMSSTEREIKNVFQRTRA